MNTKLLVILVVILVLPPPAGAAAGDAERPGDRIEISDVAGGSLLVPAGDTGRQYVPLPGMRTDIAIRVTGIAARVEVTQVFHNPSTRWLEAVYVFPLPGDSAVTRLRMRLGDRLIEGVVREKAEARREYRKARDQGRKAGLVAQQRPNLFTSHVANIPPDESIEVTVTYLETVARQADTYRLRVPLVAGPRYLPPGKDDSPEESKAIADKPEPLRNPATIPPALGKVNPVTLDFELDAGFELDHVESPYHEIELTRPAPSRAAGRLATRAFADRDFELRWRAAAGTAPRVAAFVDTGGSEAYTLLMFQPPLPDPGGPTAARELILVIDASGSMHGDSIEQALAAARFALSTLGRNDQFNLVRFSDTASMLFPAPQPAEPAALAEAERFLSRIDAEGGTNMAAALHRAFANPVTRALLRQVVFLTDGAVGNEAALFELIADRAGPARLFTVGIGSAPNDYFMRRAARAGRGTHTFIGRGDEVAVQMSALFERISRPALTDIHVDWRGMALPGEPERAPDLYSGEPLTLTARLVDFRGVTVRGRYDGRPWMQKIDAGRPARADWVSTLWARERIRQLEDDLLGGGNRDTVKRRMTRIGLNHQLVTPYTSLVAVERRVSRDRSDPLYRADAPVNLPHGWSYRHVFGSLPRTALGWRLRLALGIGLLIAGWLLWRYARITRCLPASS